MTRLELDHNERAALATALTNYLEGRALPSGDEDTPVLDEILTRLESL